MCVYREGGGHWAMMGATTSSYLVFREARLLGKTPAATLDEARCFQFL